MFPSIAIIFLIPFICINVYLFYKYSKHRFIEKNGELLVGEVIRIDCYEKRRIGSDRAFLIVYVDFDIYGREIRAVPSIKMYDYDVRNKVDVYYHVKFPETAIIYGRRRWELLLFVFSALLNTACLAALVLRLVLA